MNMVQIEANAKNVVEWNCRKRLNKLRKKPNIIQMDSVSKKAG